MLSYCHRYHAGNFADVHKHLALLAILRHLQKKPTPFCVLDAYAGEGFYDLNLAEIQKNKEYIKGYGKLSGLHNPPVLIQDLINVAQYYQDQTHIPAIYPGSPGIISRYLREQDRAIFTELHPQAHTQLQHNLGALPKRTIHKQDGLEAMNAFLPFKEGRGLVFIDPSYEVKTEYLAVAASVKKSYAKFSQGIYVIWYPILAAGYHHDLVDSVVELKHHKIKAEIWQSEWIPEPDLQEGLLGSGLIVINPPWQFEELVSESFSVIMERA